MHAKFLCICLTAVQQASQGNVLLHGLANHLDWLVALEHAIDDNMLVNCELCYDLGKTLVPCNAERSL